MKNMLLIYLHASDLLNDFIDPKKRTKSRGIKKKSQMRYF